MFRYKKSVPLSYERQGYIYFKSKSFRELPEREQERIRRLCRDIGGIYADALFTLVTSDTSPEKVCLEHHLSRATLERYVRKYFIKWPRWM